MTVSFVWGEILAILQFVAKAFLHLAPFLAISVPLAVALKRSGASDAIRTRLGKNQVIAVALATVIGAVSPLCSCGVIPVIAALLTSGVPLAPVMSFWLASPSMDPEILLLSAGSVGWPLAIWRLASTFAMSFGAGLVVIALERKNVFGNDYLKPSIARAKATPAKLAAAQPAQLSAATFEPFDCGCGPSLIVRSNSSSMGGAACACEGSGGRVDAACNCGDASRDAACDCGEGRPGGGLADILREAGRTAVSLSIWMLIAFVLEALISRYFPTEIVARLLGTDVPWAIPLAAIIGIPLYTTNLTALGVVSGLMAQGMGGGAALAFLIGGAVTTVPAMSAVWGIVKRRVFLAYLGFAVAGSLLSGYAYQLVSTLIR